jgi:hypothetical protein
MLGEKTWLVIPTYATSTKKRRKIKGKVVSTDCIVRTLEIKNRKTPTKDAFFS